MFVKVKFIQLKRNEIYILRHLKKENVIILWDRGICSNVKCQNSKVL